MCASGSAKTHYLRSKVKKHKQNNDNKQSLEGARATRQLRSVTVDLTTRSMTDAWLKEKECTNDFFDGISMLDKLHLRSRQNKTHTSKIVT